MFAIDSDGVGRASERDGVLQVWAGDLLLAWSTARTCASLPGHIPTFQCCCCWYCCFPCGFGFGLGFLTQRTHSTRMCCPLSCRSTQPMCSSLGNTPPDVRCFVTSRVSSRLMRTCRRLPGRPQPRPGEKMSPPPSASSWALRGEVVSMRRGRWRERGVVWMGLRAAMYSYYGQKSTQQHNAECGGGDDGRGKKGGMEWSLRRG